MCRLVAEEPGPGQKYAVQARRWIATLRAARPDVRIEIWWLPAQKGVEGNEKANEWAKQKAEEPDARGVEWLRYGYLYGARWMPPPRSLADLMCEISEKKWDEAWNWSKERVNAKKYWMKKQRPNGEVARVWQRGSSR